MLLGKLTEDAIHSMSSSPYRWASPRVAALATLPLVITLSQLMIVMG